MHSDASIATRHTLTLWAMRLFGFDGLLPAFVLLVPAALAVTMGNGAFIEIIATFLPSLAFLIRLALGLKNIRANTCSKTLRVFQQVALFLGLLALFLVDVFVILSWSCPANAIGRRDYEITALIFSLYLILMAIASFPGFIERDSCES